MSNPKKPSVAEKNVSPSTGEHRALRDAVYLLVIPAHPRGQEHTLLSDILVTACMLRSFSLVSYGVLNTAGNLSTKRLSKKAGLHESSVKETTQDRHGGTNHALAQRANGKH